MTIQITVCFYEYPAALHDIKLWEKLKFEEIVYKNFNKPKSFNDPQAHIITYVVQGDEYIECLMCIPNKTETILRSDEFFMDNFPKSVRMDLIRHHIDSIEGKNSKIISKLILFGKFHPEILNDIKNYYNRIIKSIEDKTNWRLV